MKLRLNQLAIALNYTQADVLKLVCQQLKCKKEQVNELVILRRSIDARKKSRAPFYVLSVEVNYSGKTVHLKPPRIEQAPKPEPNPVYSQPTCIKHPPVVVGAGPAGLMAALTLAEAGHKPLLIERGVETSEREKQVEQFWKEGRLNEESNVLYGEGGAGLFSDGKLTARSKDRARIRRFFEVLVDCGASSDILIDAMPHIGSDALTQIIPVIRNRIWALGGACAFNSRLDDIVIEHGALKGLVVSGKTIRTDACFLATGHSARDIYTLLHKNKVALEAKPFAVGIRLEIPQYRIDEAQYGHYAKLLEAASFRLTRKEENKARRCYSFCMCPGGLVISCASESGMLTSNGMSLSTRKKPFGNAAFLVPVGATDYDGKGPLAGLDFQRKLEAAAFKAGGGTYGLPAARLIDFLEGHVGELPFNRSCSQAVPVLLQDILPEFVSHTLYSAVPKMLNQLHGVQVEEALLYGTETRSSAPVRIIRDSTNFESINLAGLYPCGEGAGYAGGIVSSALDGMKLAERYALNR